MSRRNARSPSTTDCVYGNNCNVASTWFGPRARHIWQCHSMRTMLRGRVASGIHCNARPESSS
eukprot:10902855-Lingulodinium_polyedra.AAC.1